MTPAGNFFEPWDLPRLHPGRSIGPLSLENEGFLGLPPVQRNYWRFTLIVFLAFFGILFKTCVWTESNSVLSIVLGKNWHSTFRQPHKSEKNLPYLMIASSSKLEPFSTIFGFFNCFRKSLKWLLKVLETWYRNQNWSRDHTYSQLHYSNNQWEFRPLGKI